MGRGIKAIMKVAVIALVVVAGRELIVPNHPQMQMPKTAPDMVLGINTITIQQAIVRVVPVGVERIVLNQQVHSVPVMVNGLMIPMVPAVVALVKMVGSAVIVQKHVRTV